MIAVATLAAAMSLGGCEAADPFGGSQVPRPCGQVFSQARCLALADEVASRLDVTREDVASIVVQPDPTPRVVDGTTILEVRSGGVPLVLDVTLGDGSLHRLTLCGGIPSSAACFDEPQLVVSTPTEGGYFDTPENATPLPEVAPGALAAATALRLDRVDIPIDHLGQFEVRLGTADLPNGHLSTAEVALVDPWPAGVTILDGRVTLAVRSLLDGRYLWNVYEHGWRDGTEPVEAILHFDVFRFEPGAVLAIRDVVVE